MENLRAINGNIVVRKIESEEDKNTSLIIDLHDQTYMKGVVVSVGEDVEHVQVGDVVIHTDAVRSLENVDPLKASNDEYYLITEDAIYCKVK